MWQLLTFSLVLCTGLHPVHAGAEDGGGEVARGREQRRGGRALAVIKYWAINQLWPDGKLNYYIDPTETLAGHPAPFLDANDARVLQAVAHVEANTCLRFTRCSSRASCPKPHIIFSSRHGKNTSPVGLSRNGVNNIMLCPSLGWKAVVHEIGHSLGFIHEWLRNDERGDSPQTTRDLGPPDLHSIMSYKLQDPGLTPTDMKAIDFLYNGCSRTFKAPTCMASRPDTETIVVGEAHKVEFNGLFAVGKSMTVRYGPTTAPRRAVDFSVAEGGGIGRFGNTHVTFTPRAKDSGHTYTLGVEFVGSDGTSTRCSVDVTVVSHLPSPPSR